MNLKRKSIIAAAIAASIIAPIKGQEVFANGEEAQVASVDYRTITADAVNFRTGPSTSYDSMGKFYKGDKVEYISASGDWTKVRYNGKDGYVSSQYVSSSQTSNPSDDKVVGTKVVTADAVNFRTGPSTSYSSIGKLNKGTKVDFISESNGWSKIKYNGKVGYMSSQYLANENTQPEVPSDDKVVGTKVVNANSVNFRKGPSTSYSSIGKLNKGTKVDFISESNGWSKIKYNGQVGYMSSEYLSNENSEPTQPEGPSDDKVVGKKMVNANSVNFRKGPSTSYESIGKLNYGTQVDFISESNGWSKIKYNGQVGYISSQYLSEDTSNIPASEKAQKVISYAKTLLGKKYVWGAEGPNTFDCSGYTQYVFKNSVGVSIPRVSRDQAKYGQSINKNDMQPGDLVSFDTDGAINGGVTHIGIYIGNGEFIHASSSAGKVVISKLSGYYSERIVTVRRVL